MEKKYIVRLDDQEQEELRVYPETGIDVT